MSRRHYIITYDISDDKRRTKVFKALKDNGDHVQYSVFFCQLSSMELAVLRGTLQSYINAREDQIILVDLGPAHNPLDADMQCLGQPYEPPTRVTIV